MPGPYVLPCMLCLVLMMAPWALDVVKHPPAQRGEPVGRSEPPRVEAPAPDPPPALPVALRVAPAPKRALGASARTQRADGNGRMVGVVMGLLVGLGLWLMRRRLGD